MPMLLLVCLLLHGYVAARLVPALAALPVAQVLSSAAIAGSVTGLVLVVARFSRRRRGRSTPSNRALTMAGYTLLGFASSLLALTVLRDAVLVAARLVAWAVPSSWASGAWAARLPDMATFGEATALAVPVLAVAGSVAGWIGARRTAPVRTVAVAIPDLPAEFENFTIAQISDLHVGEAIRRETVAAIVERVNALGADVVAITGDLVDGSVTELGPHVAPLAGLRSRHGTHFVTGNHEYYSGVGPWLAELRRLGIKVLLNRHVVVERNGRTLVLAGVTDYSAGHFDPAHRSDPQAAIAGAPADAAVRVLLAHQPRSAAAAATAGFDLQLSGHTHGGQFLPWTFFVRRQQPFVAGLDRLGSLQIYTSRGTGYWGPPMRLGAPSEITRIRLVRAPD